MESRVRTIFSSNVRFELWTLYSSTNHNYEIRFYAVDLNDSAVIARARNYNKYNIGTWTGTWAYSKVTINTFEMIELIGSFEEMSLFNQKKVLTHEVGHSLGLDHPLSTCLTAIMYYDAEVLLAYNFNTPQQHDKDTLRAKYGQ